MSASTTKTKNQPSRKPVLLDYLKAFTKDKLIFAARQLCITYSKLKKDELAEKICTEMQKPEIAAKRFAIMPDENIHAFETALEKKCFHPTYSEYALLLPFISMGYIVSYPDDCFEAVKEARTVYKKINTADFQAHRQQLAWLSSETHPALQPPASVPVNKPHIGCPALLPVSDKFLLFPYPAGGIFLRNV